MQYNVSLPDLDQWRGVLNNTGLNGSQYWNDTAYNGSQYWNDAAFNGSQQWNDGVPNYASQHWNGSLLQTNWTYVDPLSTNGTSEGSYIWNIMNGSLDGGTNDTNMTFEAQDDVFQYHHIRVILIIAYTIVFICCFFGNLIVIVVVMVHRRMRTATNFFLANLALADLCVGVFCVYQNLLIYLAPVWSLGDFLCRMYHFIHGLSYTASILILTTISLERYVVIVHPMWGRRAITLCRLRIVVALLWLVSAIYNSPRLVMYGTVQIPTMEEEGEHYTLCVINRNIYNTAQFDLYNFVFLFVIPIKIMSVLYINIGLRLWRSEKMHREKSAVGCLCCLCPRRHKTFRRRFRMRETTSSRDTVRDEASRQDSYDNRRSQDEGFLSSDGLEFDSSCEDDELYELESKGSRKSALSKRSSIIKQSSIRSTGTKRHNGSITFAKCDSQNNSITSRLSRNVQDNMHKSSQKRTGGKDNGTSDKISEELEGVLLLNQLNLMKDNPDNLSAILENDEPASKRQYKKRSKSFNPVFRRVIQDSNFVRSVSQHGNTGYKSPSIIPDSLRSSRSSPGREDSLRSCASEVSTFIGTSSQRSQTDESTNGQSKRSKVKIHRRGSKILKSRRKIIRLLLAVVVSFTVCNLPYHARKFWQTWGPTYNGTSTTSIFLTISTTLILYMNSGINPFLYAFLSANFRRSVKDVLSCRVQAWKKHSFSQCPSNNSRLTSSTSTAPMSQGSVSSNVSNI